MSKTEERMQEALALVAAGGKLADVARQVGVSCAAINQRTYKEKATKTKIYLEKDDEVIAKMICVILIAQKTIKPCVYSFTNKELGDALLAALDREVVVKAVADYTKAYEKNRQLRRFYKDPLDTTHFPFDHERHSTTHSKPIHHHNDKEIHDHQPTKTQIIENVSQEPTWKHADLAHWATKQFKLKHTNIDWSTVDKILKRAEQIKSLSRHHMAQYKTKMAIFPELEHELVKWIDHADAKEISVARVMIQDEAHAITRRLALPAQQCKFSNGWLWSFQSRFVTKSRADYNEAGSYNLQEVLEGRLDCQDVILQYEMRNVCNLDETALNYSMYSTRSIGRKGVKKGRKLNKQRITVMLATNADGSDKIPPYLIGTAKRPRCFEGKTVSEYRLTYSANREGWMTTDLFRSWLEEVNGRFRCEDRHVLMLMDNVSPHMTDDLVLTNIRVHKLAPNTTPCNRPLDAGIIHSFKAGFRRR